MGLILRIKVILLMTSLSSMHSFASTDYTTSHTIIYSVSLKKIILQVNSNDNELFNFVECDLETNNKGKFEGHSPTNCQLISDKWLILDDPHTYRFTSVFNSSVDKQLQSDMRSIAPKVLYAAPAFVFGGLSLDMFTKIKSATSTSGKVLRGFGATGFAAAAVVTGVTAVKAFFYSPPSIETSLEENSDEPIENEYSSQKTAQSVYWLIYKAIRESLFEMGIYLST